MYLDQHIALVFEIGLMVGATGVRTTITLPEAFESMPPELREGLEQATTQAEFESWYAENQVELDQWISENQDELPEGYDLNRMASDFGSDQMSRSIRFGSGFGLDIMFGVRFP